jgi:hypothetical protein
MANIVFLHSTLQNRVFCFRPSLALLLWARSVVVVVLITLILLVIIIFALVFKLAHVVSLSIISTHLLVSLSHNERRVERCASVTACSALQLRTALKGQQIGRKEMMSPFPFPFPTTTTTTSTHQLVHHAARPPLSPLLLHSHLSLASPRMLLFAAAHHSRVGKHRGGSHRLQLNGLNAPQ